MTLFGERSVNVGKTYKVIGTLFTINRQYPEAKEYLHKAIQVYESKGMSKIVKEIRQKIKLLNSNQTRQGGVSDRDMMQAPIMADESAYDSQGDGVTQTTTA